MGLLRFGLPPQATQLRPTLGLRPEGMIQVDRGFASSDPVLPGEQEYAFAYRFPYVAPVYAFSLALPYGAAPVRVLVPAGPGWALDVAGPDLAPLGEVDVGPRRYRVWGGGQVPAGGRLQVELRNLPPRPLWRAALDLGARPQVLAGAFVVLLALAVGQALWQQRAVERAARGSPRGSLPGAAGPLPPVPAAPPGPPGRPPRGGASPGGRLPPAAGPGPDAGAGGDAPWRRRG